MQKKPCQSYAAAICHKHWCETALEKLDCLCKGGNSRVSGCTRLNSRVILKQKNRDFSCTFWKIQIYFSDLVRFLCVNLSFGASIHFILFFLIIVNNHRCDKLRRQKHKYKEIWGWLLWNKRERQRERERDPNTPEIRNHVSIGKGLV